MSTIQLENTYKMMLEIGVFKYFKYHKSTVLQTPFCEVTILYNITRLWVKSLACTFDEGPERVFMHFII